LIQGIIIAVIVLGGIALIAGIILSIASRIFVVEVNPTEEKILAILPGANCGGCGYPGCSGYARALAGGSAEPNLCSPGGAAVAKQIGAILGKEVAVKEALVARVLCQGSFDNCSPRLQYRGIQSCAAAFLMSDSRKSCIYACEGFGDCVKACPFDAIYMSAKGLPVVIKDKCTACGSCVTACPKNVIELVPLSKQLVISCRSLEPGKEVRKQCKAGCIACGICARKCPYEAIEVKENLAVIDLEKCQVCGVCAAVCPTKAVIDYRTEIPKACIAEGCDSCGECAKVCPVKKCITGEEGKPYTINEELCIGCGLCVEACPLKVIHFKKPAEKKSAA
jgi:electron transport complex protein RnfB